MTFIDTLDNIIKELEAKYNNGNLEEKEALNQDIKILKECKNALDNDDLFLRFDFKGVFSIFEREGISTSDLIKYTEEIKDVISMKKELGIEDDFYSKEQLEALDVLEEKLLEITNKLEEKASLVKADEKSKDDLEKLKELKNILLGAGKRKYYTQIDTLLDNIDYENMSSEEFASMANLFFETRNFKVKQGLNKEELEDVVDLFKEFLDPKEFDIYSEDGGLFLKLINKYADEVTTKIDLFEAREILEFFRSKGVLEKFERKALLKIALYGSANYIKELYEEKEKGGFLETDAYFTDTLARLWINGSKTRRSAFRVGRSGEQSEGKTHSLYKEISGTNDEQFMKNIEILRKNSDLFVEGEDIASLDSHVVSKIESSEYDETFYTLLDLLLHSSWSLYKNNNLIRVFHLGETYQLPISTLKYGDLEKKLHLAIELGLLNPPMDEYYRQLDKDSELNKKFLNLKSQSGINNNTIRNYFARNMSVLAITDVNTFGYLMDRLFQFGPSGFYEYFFSEKQTGMRDKVGFDEDIQRNAPNKDEYNDTHFIDNNIIPNFDFYDIEISDFNEEEKTDMDLDKKYFDKSVLDNELIQFLESNFKVVNVLTKNEELVRMQNQYLYNINGRLYSRFRVLRNASILLSIHGRLDNEMLLTCLCRETFVKQDQYEGLVKLLEERNMVR